VPLPLTTPVCPGASVTEICEGLVLPDRLTRVLPLELATLNLTGAVPLLRMLKVVGLAERVQGPVVGDGLGEADGVGVGTGVAVGVGVGLQFTPLLLQGVGVGSGVG
jgi:hypothetical protein